MAVLSQVLVCALLYIGTVNGAGYLSIRPRSSGLCYYENIEDAHFSYDRNDCEGPKRWCKLNECWTTCGSKRRQSPINIRTRQAKSRYIENLVFENTDKRVPATVFNNGHAPDFNVAVNENNEENIILTNVPGRPSYKKYIFAQLHVHLGRKKGRGSEHSIDRKFYPMEAHMVFYDSKFDNIAKAKSAKDGLVVIGVMLKVHVILRNVIFYFELNSQKM
ncbi:nacrein-like protein [Ostrea edulis]|uniref:nacrein-like protein n=1 Tax=Ostrea edulis TaxID=37623 RepID=UPI0024AF7D1E|nr:nacrein-like protein [Ostrea edulis]